MFVMQCCHLLPWAFLLPLRLYCTDCRTHAHYLCTVPWAALTCVCTCVTESACVLVGVRKFVNRSPFINFAVCYSQAFINSWGFCQGKWFSHSFLPFGASRSFEWGYAIVNSQSFCHLHVSWVHWYQGSRQQETGWRISWLQKFHRSGWKLACILYVKPKVLVLSFSILSVIMTNITTPHNQQKV